MAKWKEFNIMKDQPTYDPVEKPAHYNQGNIECIVQVFLQDRK